MDSIEMIELGQKISEPEWQQRLANRVSNLKKDLCIKLWLEIDALEEAAAYTEAEKEEFQREIDESMAAYDRGEYVTAEQFIAELNKRYE